MMIRFTDLIMADQRQSAQGRVHFITTSLGRLVLSAGKPHAAHQGERRQGRADREPDVVSCDTSVLTWVAALRH
jgi:hypothetical protein